MSAHTKGPWMALPVNPKADYYWRVSDGEDFVCQIFSKHGEFDNAKANARLIAAAPELLGALSQLLVAVEYKGPASDFGRLGEENWCFDARVPVGFVDIARAAIAKATGATP